MSIIVSVFKEISLLGSRHVSKILAYGVINATVEPCARYRYSLKGEMIPFYEESEKASWRENICTGHLPDIGGFPGSG